jgi:hypothetical protein
MSIHYGRSLPTGPRPKPPQPKSGEIGVLRGLRRAQSRRNKKNKANDIKDSTNNSRQGASPSSQEQVAAKIKKKKSKPARSRQNTPVRVEVVRPAKPSLPIRPARSNGVVVEWIRDGRRYLAWVRLGVKAVHGWKECSAETTYQQLVKKLRPIGTNLIISDSRVPVVEILDLMIAAGKVLMPTQRFPLVAPAPKQPFSSSQTQRRSRTGSRRDQGPRQRRSAAAEAERNEVLVIRPSDGKLSTAARRRESSRQSVNGSQKRRQLLARQQRGVRRLSWLRRHGYEQRDAPNDMMHVALQGGSPGLKR